MEENRNTTLCDGVQIEETQICGKVITFGDGTEMAYFPSGPCKLGGHSFGCDDKKIFYCKDAGGEKSFQWISASGRGVMWRE